ncbi:serine/threonine protein kinase [Candidatus Obscuribacterales bacterium]|nr:serine/threonine protein kinase [Candidatus Obscuribacterales bacterium]
MESKIESKCKICKKNIDDCRCAANALDTRSDTDPLSIEKAESDLFRTTIVTNNSDSQPFVDPKFRVLGELGSGGDSIVYLAEHLYLRKKVSLKLFRAIDNDTKRFARVQREAVLLAGLKHPNLVEVSDFGLTPGGVPYLVQEYIEGPDFQAYLKARGPLDEKDAIDLFCQIAAAIQFLHDNRVIHRDIKPSNVIVTGTTSGGTTAKLIDLGIAKPENPGGAMTFATASGKVFGSPYYMSPEQCSGEVVEYKTDMYSFGCLMYEALTGAPPFRGQTMLVTLEMHVNETAPRVNTRRQGSKPVSSELESVVAKCLAKNPADRYDSMNEVISALVKPEPRRKNRKRIFALVGLSIVACCLSVYFIGKSSGNLAAHSDQSVLIDRLSSAELMESATAVENVVSAYRAAYNEGLSQRVTPLTQLQLGAILMMINSECRKKTENAKVFAELEPFLKHVETKLEQEPDAFRDQSLEALWRIYLFRGDFAKSDQVSEKSYLKALKYATLCDERRGWASNATTIINSRLALLYVDQDMRKAQRLAQSSIEKFRSGDQYNREALFDSFYVQARAALSQGRLEYACKSLRYCSSLKRGSASRLPDNALEQLGAELKTRMGTEAFAQLMKSEGESAWKN